MAATNKETFELERKEIDAMTDSELASSLERIWEEGDFPETELSDIEKEKLFGEISSRLFNDSLAGLSTSTSKKYRIMRKVFRWTAAVMLPILMFTTVYFYLAASRDIDCITAVSTSDGEMASVALPDGSEIRLNSGTTLSYNPYSFSKGKRMVGLQGEAFFSVKSDARHPFCVNAGEVDLAVKGTKFSVMAYPDKKDITVLLTEGIVEMHGRGMERTVRLQPWQKAVYDKSTERTEIFDADGRDANLAWINSEMSFRNASVEELVSAIEMHYGVEFDDGVVAKLPDDGFTGILPTDNISTVFDVLEDVYDISFTLKGRKIIVN